MGSHSVTWHLTQVNTLRLNPGQTGRYLIYLPLAEDGRLFARFHGPYVWLCRQTWL